MCSGVLRPISAGSGQPWGWLHVRAGLWHFLGLLGAVPELAERRDCAPGSEIGISASRFNWTLYRGAWEMNELFAIRFFLPGMGI